MSQVTTVVTPVISTIHMPGTEAISKLMALEVPAADWMYGGFVLVTQDVDRGDATAWLRPIEAWALKNGYSWVRFDCDGDELDELPKFHEHW